MFFVFIIVVLSWLFWDLYLFKYNTWIVECSSIRCEYSNRFVSKSRDLSINGEYSLTKLAPSHGTTTITMMYNWETLLKSVKVIHAMLVDFCCASIVTILFCRNIKLQMWHFDVLERLILQYHVSITPEHVNR
jgi:hypothetical protein